MVRDLDKLLAETRRRKDEAITAYNRALQEGRTEFADALRMKVILCEENYASVSKEHREMLALKFGDYRVRLKH